MSNKIKNILSDIYIAIVVIAMILIFLELATQYIFEMSFYDYVGGLILWNYHK